MCPRFQLFPGFHPFRFGGIVAVALDRIANRQDKRRFLSAEFLPDLFIYSGNVLARAVADDRETEWRWRRSGRQEHAKAGNQNTGGRKNSWAQAVFRLAPLYERFVNPEKMQRCVILNTPASAQLIGPAAEQTHAFGVDYADQLDAAVIAAIPIVRESHQFSRCHLQIRVPGYHFGHFRSCDGTVQTIGAEQQNVSRLNLMIADLDIGEEIAAERPAEQMPRRGFRRLLSGKNSQTILFRRDGMIPR